MINKNSAMVRVRNKIKRPDARIAFAMPPRIETNIIMVMREDTYHDESSAYINYYFRPPGVLPRNKYNINK